MLPRPLHVAGSHAGPHAEGACDRFCRRMVDVGPVHVGHLTQKLGGDYALALADTKLLEEVGRWAGK